MKVKLQDIIDALEWDVDSAVVDDFYKVANTIADSRGFINTDNAEFQLFLRDFLESHELDYQYDLIKNVLEPYYDHSYDLEEEFFGVSDEVKQDSINKGLYSEELEEDYNRPQNTLIDTGLSDRKAEEVLLSVIGQLSDGIWENSRGMEKYWQYADIIKKGSEIYISVNTENYESGYRGKSEQDIKRYFAQKVKQIVKEEGLEWSRDNTEISAYLDRGSDVTVQDAYRVYDKLLGRIDRIKTESKAIDYDYILKQIKFLQNQDSHVLTIPDDFDTLINVNIPKDDKYWTILDKILKDEEKSKGVYYSIDEVLEELYEYIKSKYEVNENKEIKTESGKRIARYREFDNGHVLHQWDEMSNEEAEEKAKQASIENPNDVYYVAYDDIMNPRSDISWYRGNQYTIEDIMNKRHLQESINFDGFKNNEELQKYFQKLNELPDEITLDGKDYFQEQYGTLTNGNNYVVYTDKNNNDSYIKVYYTLKQVDDNTQKGIDTIVGVTDLREED